MDFNRKNVLSLTCCFLACFYYYYFRHSEDDTKVYQKCHQEFLHKDAKSAMNRTKTEQCRQEIFEVACRNSQSLYPEFIQSQCNIEIRPEDIQVSMTSSPNSSVRVAYLFVVHGRGLRQILRLFKLLYDEKDYFYFHVDQRDTYLYR